MHKKPEQHDAYGDANNCQEGIAPTPGNMTPIGFAHADILAGVDGALKTRSTLRSGSSGLSKSREQGAAPILG